MVRWFFVIVFMVLMGAVSSQDFNVVLQDTKDSSICSNRNISLLCVGYVGEPPIRYDWSLNGASLPDKDSIINISVEQYASSLDVNCTIYGVGFDKTKGNADSVLSVVEKKFVISNAPVLSVLPTYAVTNDNLILISSSKVDSVKYLWTNSNGEMYNGQIQTINNVRASQMGLYTLSVTDTNSACSSVYSLEVKPSGPVGKKPENIFGTTDEFGDKDLLIRSVDRDLPVYPSSIEGRMIPGGYVVASHYTKWQVLGEVDEYYLVQFVPNYIDTRDQYRSRVELERDLRVREIDVRTKKNSLLSLGRGSSYRLVSRDIKKLERKIEEIENKLSKLPSAVDFEEYFKYYSTAETGQKKYFLVKRNDFMARTNAFEYTSTLRRPRFTAGTILIPVKLRFNEFDFSKDVTLGPFIGAKWSLSNFNPSYLSVGLSTGISSVTLSPFNTDSPRVTSVTNVAAFTYSLGVIYEYNKVQVGGFVGFDLINNNESIGDNVGFNWKYQNAAWVSIGLGYSIISRPSKKKGNKP